METLNHEYLPWPTDLDGRKLQDNMSAEWPFSLIKEIVMERVNQFSIDTVFIVPLISL